jgi:hypothetical protein
MVSNKPINVHEYSSLFPTLVPLTSKYRPKEKTQHYLKNFQTRFQDTLDIDKVMSGETKIPISA